MSYVNLLPTIPTVLKAKFRKIENVSLKMINCKWSQIFNKICLKEELMPNYLKILLNRVIVNLFKWTYKLKLCT